MKLNSKQIYVQPPPAPPEFPPYPVRACVLGKAFSGKTTVLKKLAEGELTYEADYLLLKSLTGCFSFLSLMAQ